MTSPSLALIVGGCLALCAVPVRAQAPSDASAPPVGKAINVRAMGAKGDGTTDDAPALNGAIEQAKRLGPGASVYIPAGNYLMATKTFTINGASDLNVYGDGNATVLIAKDGRQPVLSMTRCKNVSVRKLVLDRADYYFTQGTVDSVDQIAKTCTVTLDPGYPDAGSPPIAAMNEFRPFTYPASGVYQQDHYISAIKGRDKIGERQWRLTMGDRGVEDDWVGKQFIIWVGNAPGHGVNASADSNCLFEDMTYYGRGADAGFYMSNCPGDMTMRRFNIDVPPGSKGLLSCAGGGQFMNIRGKLVFDGCKFVKFDDDGADILTTYTRIIQQVDPKTLLLQTDAGFQVGDTLAVVNWAVKTERGTAIITGVERKQDQTCLVTLDRDVTVGTTGAGDGTNRGRPQMADGIDRAVDYNDTTSSTEFRDCEFQCLRARPLNLKAQNCLVERCKFFDCEMPAIAAGPEFYWEEAPAIHHLTVRNCQFTNCDTSNIDVDLFDAESEFNGNKAATSYDNHDILIEGNTFTHYGAYPTVHHYISGCAVHVRYATNVIIRNNNFDDPAPTAPPGVPKVLIQHSLSVTIENNQGLPDSAIKQE